MTVDFLSSLAGMLLQLLVAYLPGVESWYVGLSGKQKSAAMGGLLVLVSLGVFAASCTGLGADFGLALACTKSDAIALGRILVNALIANQVTYLIAVKSFK